MFSVVSLVELLLIFIIVLIIFGAGKLPQVGEGPASPSMASRSRCTMQRRKRCGIALIRLRSCRSSSRIMVHDRENNLCLHM